MALLVIAPDMKVSSFVKHINKCDDRIDIRVWPETGNEEEITFALVWKHPLGELRHFPNLKCIASLGAGVDHILRDSLLPEGVPITRIIDRSMPQSMTEYVIWGVLNYCRQMEDYHQKQIRREWRPQIPLPTQKTTIGIMGLGQLGADAAGKLNRLGFPVIGWSRRSKSLEGVQSFSGQQQFSEFLSRSKILICMLPLTPATRNILNRETFTMLPEGAYLINVARGQHLVEEDLLAALESGRLSGACLDVFQIEPLPGNHPFWAHPDIIVTPHISSLTFPRAVAPQIVENYQRIVAKKPPVNTVDIEYGY